LNRVYYELATWLARWALFLSEYRVRIERWDGSRFLIWYPVSIAMRNSKEHIMKKRKEADMG